MDDALLGKVKTNLLLISAANYIRCLWGKYWYCVPSHRAVGLNICL